MKGMEYCLIALNNIDGIQDEIASVASSKVVIVESKNILMAKFTSIMQPFDLRSIFENGESRSFFIFELNPLTATAHIGIEDYHNKLFKDFDAKAIEVEKRLENITGTYSQNYLSDIFTSMFGITNLFEGHNPLSGDSKMRNPLVDYSILYPGVTLNKKESENNLVKQKVEDEYQVEELEKLSRKKKDELINDILKKGKELTKKDKDILDFLAKN